MKKDAMMSLRLPRDVKDALARTAEREMRSCGQVVLRMLVEGLVRQGEMSEDTPLRAGHASGKGASTGRVYA